MVQRVVDLTEEEAEKLDELARTLEVPAQELLHKAVNGLLRTSASPSRPTEDDWRRAAALSGRFNFGLRDLSENHDKYLAEAFAS